MVPVRLEDGTTVFLRPAVSADRRLIESGFGRLSPQSRYQRFFTPVLELSPTALDHLSDVDGADHRAIAAVVHEGAEEVGVGVARYVRLDDPEAAEVAVTVIDEYQGRGLGRHLFDALAAEALRRGITRFEGTVLVENRGMQAILRRAGARFSWAEEGVIAFEVDLRARPPAGGSSSGLER